MHGLYVLVLRVQPAASLVIGALGRHALAPGTYLYVGSARRGLSARVQRHFRCNKAIRWHIDYLTSAPQCQPRGAVLVADGRIGECGLNRLVAQRLGAVAPVAGFGASDCRSGCPAHLWKLRRAAAPARVARELKAAGLTASTVLP